MNSNNNNKIEDEKTWALVTGATRGIGRAICIKLAQKGFNILALYKNNHQLAQELKDEIENINFNSNKNSKICCEILSADLEGNIQDIIETLTPVVKKISKISVLVNNAGATNDMLFYEMNSNDWMKSINVNLNSMWAVTKVIIKQMIRNRGGRIINVTSVTAETGNAGQTNYAAAKGGVISFTKALAKEVARRGITVNAVSPGVIETDMIKNVPKEVINFIPLGRVGLPIEVAHLVAFLASEESAYITGQVIRINGGLYT
ncbi:MAG: 3-oxoacyl-ACP reductase FabG [Oligoflexia bacterium]|nr:3-oxoacyl-ACP reductase FabG [Oligoflexia bacterium]